MQRWKSNQYAAVHGDTQIEQTIEPRIYPISMYIETSNCLVFDNTVIPIIRTNRVTRKIKQKYKQNIDNENENF